VIHWQSLAFKKSASVLAVKRQSPVLRPYSAAGEFNFLRGAGVTLQRKKWEATVFVSRRKTDANTEADTTGEAAGSISSLPSSGYHRTAAELAHRNRVKVYTAGANIKWSNQQAHIGFNTVHHRLSLPFQFAVEPYERYAITGPAWSNYSIDYSYTFRNMYVYGELATDKHGNSAWLNGMLVSIAAKTDIALVYRRMSPAYRSLLGNAFTENTLPANERGLYAGISVRPVYGWQINAYADVYSFPWLKYRVDAPSGGRDYLVQVSYTPNKQVELYSRYTAEGKPVNFTNAGLPVKPVEGAMHVNWRTNLVFRASKTWSLQNRIEWVRYSLDKRDPQSGFSGLMEIAYNGDGKTLSASGRIQYFETDDYESRIYAYERDVLYSFSIPMFYKKGFRYYINTKTNVSRLMPYQCRKKYTCLLWLRWAQTIFAQQTSNGSAYDEIPGNRKSEFSMQVIITVK
jgi:hypothetical protein